MNNTIQHKSVRLLFALLVGFFTINTVNAQSSLEGLTYEDVEFYQYEDSLFLSFNLKMEGDFLSSGNALYIYPVYETEKWALSFTGILVNGKKRAGFFRREQSFLPKEDRAENLFHTVITRKNKEVQVVAYSAALIMPKEAISEGKLYFEPFLHDCCNTGLIGDRQAFELERRLATPNPAMFANTVTYITPQAEQDKKRNNHIVVRIDYPQNKYEVLPNFGNNKAEIQKLTDELQPLYSSSETYQIDSASVKGYASPEGVYKYNLNLSKRRTETFKKFLSNKYELISLNNFQAQGLGEDWDGLLKAVESSNMEHKIEVMHIINTIGISDGREKQLMSLADGKPYNYMLRELFPALRRIELNISYTVAPIDSEIIGNNIQNRIEELSEHEIYSYALKNKNNDLLLKAAAYFPNSATANINASSVALVKGNMDEAWIYLSKVQNNPKAYNNLGIYYWLKGNTEKASSYFSKAMNVDGQKENAKANMKMMEEY